MFKFFRNLFSYSHGITGHILGIDRSINTDKELIAKVKEEMVWFFSNMSVDHSKTKRYDGMTMLIHQSGSIEHRWYYTPKDKFDSNTIGTALLFKGELVYMKKGDDTYIPVDSKIEDAYTQLKAIHSKVSAEKEAKRKKEEAEKENEKQAALVKVLRENPELRQALLNGVVNAALQPRRRRSSNTVVINNSREESLLDTVVDIGVSAAVGSAVGMGISSLFDDDD